MDSNVLAQAMGNNPQVDYQRMVGPISEAMIAADVTNANRAAMWIAQIGHESAGLRWMEEIASGAAYNGRRDLGNTQPGDGPRFKGRGPIQLTGRNNYRVFTRWAQAQGHTTINFEAEPHRVAEPKWGFLAASWYWTVARPDINALSDRRDLETVTRRINGGLNGLADRRQRYNRALAMGDRILPTGGNVSNVQAVEKPNPNWRGDPTFLPELLRLWGVNVVERPGWKNTGQGDFDDIWGIIAHHTGDANTSPEIIAKGHSALRGLLSQIHLDPKGTATITGAGIAYHAGEGQLPGLGKGYVNRKSVTGVKSYTIGNARTIGIEAQHSGNPRDPWPEEQMEAYARICAAIAWFLGWGTDRIWGHKEYATPKGRKIDPTFDMEGFRRRVQGLLNNPPASVVGQAAPKDVEAPTPTPAPEKPETPREDPRDLTLEELKVAIADIREQLTGSRFPGRYDGWKQLGVDQNGKPLTLVDAIASIHQKVSDN